MRIDLQQLRKAPVTRDVELPSEFLGEDVEEDLRFDAATGDVTFRLLGDDVLATGKLHSRVYGPCARCLAEAGHDIDVDVLLNYWPRIGNEGSKIVDIDPDEPDYTLYEGSEIVPDEDLRQLIVVEVPDVLICGDDCKGLCPHCGANLNETACDCETEAATPEKPDEPDWKEKLRDIKLD